MTIQMANRLVELRKAAGLSQDAVAERIGVSRQAVSKWERAEAAPDTDNLIALAKLYNVSVDELLDPDKGSDKTQKKESDTAIDVELPFIKIKINGDRFEKDKHKCCDRSDPKEDIEPEDIEVEIEEDEDNGFKYVYVPDENKKSLWQSFPYPVLATIAYLLMGFVWDLWHPGWIVFLTIPIYYWIANSIVKRRFSAVSVSFLVTAAYLVMGLGWSMWHPWWLLFLAIPIFEFIVKAFKR